MLHDRIVARKIPGLKDKIDIIHAWPLGALHTIRAAKKVGIPVALERCNAHTRFAYEVVKKECDRIGVPLPRGHEHAYDEQILALEEQEYTEADALLCPSEFTARTFRDYGFPPQKIARFIYGVDDSKFYPENRTAPSQSGLKAIYVGVCAVRKGLHFALEAWLNSSASQDGTFYIVGEFIPDYQKKLAPMLSHPSIKVLGHRNDVPELMRQCDIFIMPSIEEGFALVCTEAMASGCVPLVSDACTDLCRHMENSLVHRVCDVPALTEHLIKVHADRNFLAQLRRQGLALVPKVTWLAAGVQLLEAYRSVISKRAQS